MMGGTRARGFAHRSFVIPILAVAAAFAASGTAASSAHAASAKDGVKHLHFKFGPVQIQPGQNKVLYTRDAVPKPKEDGYVVRIAPNIRKLDGTVPPVDVIHLHHGVWINGSHTDAAGHWLPERFFAVGEEKTITQLPSGYGYAYKASDWWIINYMIHDLTPAPYKIWITYDIDFIPATSPAARNIIPVRPIWLDVQNGVGTFDVIKGSGTNGTFTYPDQAIDPYHGGLPMNEWTVDHDGGLIATAGHLHPGGLHDDLWLDRPGAVAQPGSSAVNGKPGAAHLFQSTTHYWEPAGAVSWDVGVTATPPDWRVQVHAGDVVSLSSTYDSKRASWYESMGLLVLWMADGTGGKDPFATKVDYPGHLTHGRLPENRHHGGKKVTLADATKFVPTPLSGPIPIDNFLYRFGDMTGRPQLPQVKAGQSLTFANVDAPKGNGIWHTITACRAPCNRETGIAYPLADGDVQFDSGELGIAGVPTAGRLTWQTPPDLPTGTYTYFCRIHPFMRGGFQVVAAS